MQGIKGFLQSNIRPTYEYIKSFGKIL